MGEAQLAHARFFVFNFIAGSMLKNGDTTNDKRFYENSFRRAHACF